MPQTNFDRITASPEVLAAFLASLPCLDAPWDDAFHRVFCDNCPTRPGTVKIVDQAHAAELLELANDSLS